MLEKEQNSKIIWNAISAYFMIFVSGMFLFNRSNPLLNNNFVKKHTKSALMIHLGFLITYMIFISYWILAGIQIWWFAVNYIFASALCIVFLWMLLYWVFKASKWESFAIWEIIKISKVSSVAGVNNESSNLEERDKLDILLSYIPFFSFYISPKHKNNENILYASRGSLFLTVILILLFNFGYVNIVIFLVLLYTIYVVFVGLNLFTSWNIIQLRLSDIFSPAYKFDYTQGLLKYLKDYIKWAELKNLQEYVEIVQDNKKTEQDKLNEQVLSLPDLKLPKFAIYLPLLNLLYIFTKENKYSTHIRNGLIMSILFIITILLLKFSTLSYGFLYLFVIVAIYWIWYVHTQPVYKMPYIYMCYTGWKKITGKTKEANAKYNVEKNVNLKVEEKENNFKIKTKIQLKCYYECS